MRTDGRVLVLQHQDDDPPGNLALWLDDEGIAWQLVDVATDELPRPARYRALVVLGSQESVLDPVAPWALPERAFVRAQTEVGTPVLGICYGAQLLSQVLGGAVHRSSQPEHGWTDITPVHPESPFAEAVRGCWFEWHEDEISLPPRATLIAQNQHAQAFGHGRHLGVQFHPEITSELIHAWITSERWQRRVAEVRGGTEQILEATHKRHRSAEQAARRLYRAFLDCADG
ncbi:type 1 glutamine amidotransferase [Streptomyces sp. NPDC059224]|uniref:type 1 glutamine amidotransferase n=1 Tax=Streptomyces sp. NPDC059224 TaxID=3346775 RepID=UPI0036D098D4